MPCIVILLCLMAPRLMIIIAALFTNWFEVAYQSAVWPILGFFFMPLTTLAYAVAMVYNDHTISGGYLILVIAAVVLDLCGHGATATGRRNGD